MPALREELCCAERTCVVDRCDSPALDRDDKVVTETAAERADDITNGYRISGLFMAVHLREGENGAALLYQDLPARPRWGVYPPCRPFNPLVVGCAGPPRGCVQDCVCVRSAGDEDCSRCNVLAGCCYEDLLPCFGREEEGVSRHSIEFEEIERVDETAPCFNRVVLSVFVVEFVSLGNRPPACDENVHRWFIWSR